MGAQYAGQDRADHHTTLSRSGCLQQVSSVAGQGVGVAGVGRPGGSLGHVGAGVGGRGARVGGRGARVRDREGAGATGQGLVQPVQQEQQLGGGVVGGTWLPKIIILTVRVGS